MQAEMLKITVGQLLEIEPMNITKISNPGSLMVNVKEEHYFHEKAVSVEYSELFQLYNQDALDKSIVSCYCL